MCAEFLYFQEYQLIYTFISYFSTGWHSHILACRTGGISTLHPSF